MIYERRRLVDKLMAGLLGLPAGMVVVALIVLSDNPHELMAGGPIFAYLIYGWLVFVFNATQVWVDGEGFRMKTGPLPCGMPGVEARKGEVKALFPRQVLVVEKHTRRLEYYASVELEDGRWVNLLGPHKDWAGASAAAMQVATLWKFAAVDAGRTGRPSGTDWGTLWVLMVWGVGLLAALVWGIAVEVLR
jgi:hypothetical protein